MDANVLLKPRAPPHGKDAAHRTTPNASHRSTPRLTKSATRLEREAHEHDKAQQRLRVRIAEKILHSHADLLELFEQWDVSGDEVLSEDEFWRGVSQLLHLKSANMQAAVAELFRDLDPEGTGRLAYRELHDMLKPLIASIEHRERFEHSRDDRFAIQTEQGMPGYGVTTGGASVSKTLVRRSAVRATASAHAAPRAHRRLPSPRAVPLGARRQPKGRKTYGTGGKNAKVRRPIERA